MEDVKQVEVIAADRLNDSVILTFDDGRCGIYTSDLLYSMLPSAREIHESEDHEASEPAGR